MPFGTAGGIQCHRHMLPHLFSYSRQTQAFSKAIHNETCVFLPLVLSRVRREDFC